MRLPIADLDPHYTANVERKAKKGGWPGRAPHLTGAAGATIVPTMNTQPLIDPAITTFSTQELTWEAICQVKSVS